MAAPSYRLPPGVTIEAAEISAWIVGSEARALERVPGAPRLSGAACKSLREIPVVDERGEHRFINVPTERPLTVFIGGRKLVTLMTLGACPELLVLGYLRNQRIIADAAAIESIAVDWQSCAAAVNLRGANVGLEATPAGLSAASGCGLGTAFGDWLRQLDAAGLAPASSARISEDTLLRVLDTMRHHDAIHRAAGSVHSCALFRGADLWASVEDVSRHNGVDTIAGWMALHGVAGGDKILFTTGRLTGEMVLKCAYNGVPIMVSRNGTTAMGHELAARLGMTLFVRAANRRFLCCAGAQRFDAEPANH